MNDKKLSHKHGETYYQTLMEISPDALLIIDQNGKIVDSNAKAAQFFGLTYDSSTNEQVIFDFMLPEDRDTAKTDIGRAILNEELHDVEYRLQQPDGTILWGSISAKLIPFAEKNLKTILVLIRDITKRKIAEESLRNLTVTDVLTGLYNRRGFSLAAEQEIKHASRRKEGLVLLFLDINNLKIINDTFGHDEGDNAIREAAKALRATFRESDIVARWGGDEFIVLALDVPKGRVPVLLQRLDQVLQKFNEKKDVAYNISFSIGIARYDPATPSGLTEMEKIADEMMYKEKQEKNLSNKMILKATVFRDTTVI